MRDANNAAVPVPPEILTPAGQVVRPRRKQRTRDRQRDEPFGRPLAGSRTGEVRAPDAGRDDTAAPAHLATVDTELDPFMPVTTELGDIVLGPPGTTPAELAEA